MSELKVGDRVRTSDGLVAEVVKVNAKKEIADIRMIGGVSVAWPFEHLTKLDDEVEDKKNGVSVAYPYWSTGMPEEKKICEERSFVNWKPAKRTLADVLKTKIDGKMGLYVHPHPHLKNEIIIKQGQNHVTLDFESIKKTWELFGEILKEVE